MSSIVLKLPNSKLGGTGHTVGIWATTAIKTTSGWQRIDRMGRPAINTVFNITDGEKDLSNLLNPTDDRSTMKDTTVAVLSALSAVVVHAGATGYTAAQINAIRLCTFVVDPAKVFGQPCVEARRLRWEERHQRVMRRLTYGGRQGERAGGRPDAGIALIIPDN